MIDKTVDLNGKYFNWELCVISNFSKFLVSIIKLSDVKNNFVQLVVLFGNSLIVFFFNSLF